MKRDWSYQFFLVAIVLAAAGLLLAGSWYSYTSTFDTATVGLMSVNILQGDRPLFFYGQPYFGALEAYIAAFFLAVFGFSEFVVSLSPISFTLAWIVFSYLLFCRIHNRTAGIIAAACTAFPGYYVFYYSIATYGGYSVIPCVGTALLWLALRMLQEKVAKGLLVVHAMAIGLLMAAGIWVHPLTFPYIIVAAGILAIFLLRERFRPDLIGSLALAVLLALTGFLPFYLETGSLLGGISARSQPSWSIIADGLSTLFTVNIHELVVWNFRHIYPSEVVRFLIEYGSVGVLCIGFLLALYAIIFSKAGDGTKTNYLVPLAYCLLFLMLYVQHHMATIKAPRYAINFWSMLLCVCWSLAITGQTKRVLKILSIVLFCCWIGYQAVGTIFFISGNSAGARAEQQRMRDVVAAARTKKLNSVVLYGDTLFGYKSLKLSMYSQNTIVFANAELERYHNNAQFTETDPHRGYLTNAEFKPFLENSLKELGVHYTVEQIDTYFLYSDLTQEPRHVMRAVANREVRVRYSAQEKNAWKKMGHLGDRNQDVDGESQAIGMESVVFDTGRLRNLCGIWMFTAYDPRADHWKGFGRYEVLVSQDGLSYEKVYSSLPHNTNAFHAGPLVYIGGRLGRGESLFAPVRGRYLKISFLQKSPSPITEVQIFETDGSLRGGDEEDIASLVQLITAENIDFVLADRWVSAKLRESFKGSNKADVALPRHSTKFQSKPLRYLLTPARGQALVCDSAVADGCAESLVNEYGNGVIANRLVLCNYTLFILGNFSDHEKLPRSGDPSGLLWNGHVLLQTKDMTLLAPWLHSRGVPVWRADYTRTKGVYHDSWTNGNGKFYGLDYRIDNERDQELIIHTHGWLGGKDMSSLQLQVLANNNITLPYKENREKAYVYSLPPDLTRLDSLTIKSTTFIPNSEDTRSLGIDIKRIEIR